MTETHDQVSDELVDHSTAEAPPTDVPPRPARGDAARVNVVFPPSEGAASSGDGDRLGLADVRTRQW